MDESQKYCVCLWIEQRRWRLESNLLLSFQVELHRFLGRASVPSLRLSCHGFLRLGLRASRCCLWMLLVTRLDSHEEKQWEIFVLKASLLRT